MIEYIIPENPDDRIIDKAVNALKNDSVICFPTNTNWVLAANPFSKNAVKSLYRIKGMDPKKHLSLLCDTLSQASKYAIITNDVFKAIKGKLPGPYTFIFPPSSHLPRAIRDYKKEKEIGIRITKSPLCDRLLSLFGEPILVTSISPSMIEDEIYDGTLYGYQIDASIGNFIEIILDPGEVETLGASTVINFAHMDEDGPILLREGSGDPSFLF